MSGLIRSLNNEALYTIVYDDNLRGFLKEYDKKSGKILSEKKN